MVDKPRLSREYVFVPLGLVDLTIADLSVNQMAFTAAGVEPAEIDWITAIPVNSAHALFDPNIGDSFALLIGPARGDVVTTEDLALGDYQVWIDGAVTGSDERIVRAAGVLSITTDTT